MSTPTSYRLADHGDSNEQMYWRLFVRTEWPAYEAFWRSRVVPLTGRETHSSIHFLSARELLANGHSDHDIAVAQLHYTTLLHVGRVFAILQGRSVERDELHDGIARLVGALDAADELLQRCHRPGHYSALDEKAGDTARSDWRGAHHSNRSLSTKPIRDYRNRLLHGRIVPEVIVMSRPFTAPSSGGLPPHPPSTGSSAIFTASAAGSVTSYSASPPASASVAGNPERRYPKIGAEGRYVDWRRAFTAMPSEIRSDFDSARNILDFARREVVSYLELSWRDHLL